MQNEAYKIKAAAELILPEHMVDGMVAWVMDGQWAGDFLMAVLANDLMGALGQADHINMESLPAYGRFLCNDAPGGCWGSAETVHDWHDCQGLNGITRMAKAAADNITDAFDKADIKEK